MCHIDAKDAFLPNFSPSHMESNTIANSNFVGKIRMSTQILNMGLDAFACVLYKNMEIFAMSTSTSLHAYTIMEEVVPGIVHHMVHHVDANGTIMPLLCYPILTASRMCAVYLKIMTWSHLQQRDAVVKA